MKVRLSFLQADVSLVTIRVPQRVPEHNAKRREQVGRFTIFYRIRKKYSLSGDTGRLNAGKCLTMEWKCKERHFEVEIEKKYAGNLYQEKV